MRLKNKIKEIIKKSFIRQYYEHGYFDFEILKFRFINWVFQRVLRRNSKVPWSVNFTSRVTVPEKIRFGKKVWMSFVVSGNCYFQGGNGISIGDNTIWGPGVGIISANHDPDNKFAWKATRPIKIGRNCWIGMNAVILPGVELGDNVVVGAGAIVTKSFPSNVIIAGNPAKIIRIIK
jgi:acetyltransferase-like isoleucine patch superfamily enzyme